MKRKSGISEATADRMLSEIPREAAELLRTLFHREEPPRAQQITTLENSLRILRARPNADRAPTKGLIAFHEKRLAALRASVGDVATYCQISKPCAPGSPVCPACKARVAASLAGFDRLGS